MQSFVGLASLCGFVLGLVTLVVLFRRAASVGSMSRQQKGLAWTAAAILALAMGLMIVAWGAPRSTYWFYLVPSLAFLIRASIYFLAK